MRLQEEGRLSTSLADAASARFHLRLRARHLRHARASVDVPDVVSGALLVIAQLVTRVLPRLIPDVPEGVEGGKIDIHRASRALHRDLRLPTSVYSAVEPGTEPPEVLDRRGTRLAASRDESRDAAPRHPYPEQLMICVSLLF